MTNVEGSIELAKLSDLPLRGKAARKAPPLNMRSETIHAHKEGLLTPASDSAGSSPTTTFSIVDDSSATEMSPESSPESPMAKAYPSTFPIMQTRPHTSDNHRGLHPPTPFFDLQRPTTPGRRPRNLKNLAVNTSGSLQTSRAASTTSLPMTSVFKSTQQLDDSTASFSKPPSPPKRRPTNLGLTILTPSNTNALSQHMGQAIPPTPAFSRPNLLRHFQSSPSLPLYHCDTIREFTPLIPEARTSIETPSDQETPLNNEPEPNFDVPLSKEEKPKAYPDGPIRVYGPNLDLYLEPTAEQARHYDVVMNVASEVRNPFQTPIEELVQETSEIRLDGGGGIQYAPRRPLLDARKGVLHREVLSPVIESLPATAQTTPIRDEYAQSGDDPRAKGSEPEYIHVPWEHNTDIVPDLLRLVKSIDDRVQDGKRVLIHCQCGVSRSATLVVAYVMYKNPSMSVQEAYDAVKERSKWIGPNMNLIMQLQEFRTALTRPNIRFSTSRGLSPISPSVPISEWGRPGPHSGPSVDLQLPKTAPLLAEGRPSSQLVVDRDPAAVSPGPSSAPSGFTWPSHNDRSDPVSGPAPTSHPKESRMQQTADHGSPRNKQPSSTGVANDRPQSLNLEHIRHDSGRHIEPLVSPRSLEFAMGPLMPSKDVHSDDAFGLMSPRHSEFHHAPLDRDALLSSLGMGAAIEEMPTRNRELSPRAGLSPGWNPSLRSKVSAPSLREQQELENLQSELAATLAKQARERNTGVLGPEALMSPRAFEFTQNPFTAVPDGKVAMAAVPESNDPRSPPQKGTSPITRNIFDVL